MPWPSPQDYSEAVQNAKVAFCEAELQQGIPELNALGLPRPRSGSFATVFKILCQGRNWAVRCFLNPVSDQQERYGAISSHLAKIQLPYLVQFSFLTQGIRVSKQVYPILKMEWVEGEPIARYIERNLANRRTLLELAGKWFEMTKSLSRASIAHGDLQHGNILVLNGNLKLVDYDGMYVPTLSGRKSAELGQRNFQHPLRSEYDYGSNLDNFSSWVIYVSIVALASQPHLWQQFRGGDECLLFRREDFQSPDKSAMFRALEAIRDERLRAALALFRSLLELSPRDVPSLEGRITVDEQSLVERASRPGWINDHVPQVSKSTPDKQLQNFDSEPTPSWIQDFISQPSSDEKLRQFQNSTRRERIVLAISLAAFLLFGTDAYLGTITPLIFAGVSLMISACNYLLWLSRFRSEPAVLSRGLVIRDLKAIGDRIDAAKALVRRTDDAKRVSNEKCGVDRSKATKSLEALRTEEKNEVAAIHAIFQAERLSLNTKRKAVDQQEAASLQGISKTLGSKLATIVHRITALSSSEANELAASLLRRQTEYTTWYLERYKIEDATISGFGPGYKSRLRAYGILTAANIDNRIYNVKGVGATRANSIIAWHQGLKAKAQNAMPTSLPPLESANIRAKYSHQLQALQTERVIVEEQVKQAEDSVRSSNHGARKQFDESEFRAAEVSRLKTDDVRSRYTERLKALDGIIDKIGEEFDRRTASLEAQSSLDRKRLFALHWEQEKTRRRLREFSAISLLLYIRRIFGLG